MGRCVIGGVDVAGIKANGLDVQRVMRNGEQLWPQAYGPWNSGRWNVIFVNGEPYEGAAATSSACVDGKFTVTISGSVCELYYSHIDACWKMDIDGDVVSITGAKNATYLTYSIEGQLAIKLVWVSALTNFNHGKWDCGLPLATFDYEDGAYVFYNVGPGDLFKIVKASASSCEVFYNGASIGTMAYSEDVNTMSITYEGTPLTFTWSET